MTAREKTLAGVKRKNSLSVNTSIKNVTKGRKGIDEESEQSIKPKITKKAVKIIII